MVSVYDLKPKFQKRLRPLCGRFAVAGITANQVTLTAAAISVAYGCAMYFTGAARWILLLLPLVLFVRMALNAIDGMLAREFGQQSKLGAVLNELGDVVSFLGDVDLSGGDDVEEVAGVALSDQSGACRGGHG